MKTRILVWGLLLVLLLSAFAACDSPSPLKSMSDEERLAFFNEITADYRENGYRQSGSLTYERKLLNGNKFDTLEREETFSFTVLADDGEVEEYLAEWERSDVYTPADKPVSGLVKETYRVVEAMNDGTLYFGSYPEERDAFLVMDACEDIKGTAERAAGLSMPLLSPDQFKTVTVSHHVGKGGYAVTVKDPLPEAEAALTRWIRRAAAGQGIDLRLADSEITLFYTAKGNPDIQRVDLTFEASEGAMTLNVEGDVEIDSRGKRASCLPDDSEGYLTVEGLLTALYAEDTWMDILTRRDLQFTMDVDLSVRNTMTGAMSEGSDKSDVRYGFWDDSFRYEIQGIKNANQKGDRVTFDGETQTVTPILGSTTVTPQTVKSAKQSMAGLLNPLHFDLRELSEIAVQEQVNGNLSVTLTFAVPERFDNRFNSVVTGAVTVKTAERTVRLVMTPEGKMVSATLKLSGETKSGDYTLKANDTLSVTKIQ